MGASQENSDDLDQFRDEWVECWNCGGEGFSYHDCGEDCCCCANPEDNLPCDICDGDGGWHRQETTPQGKEVGRAE